MNHELRLLSDNDVEELDNLLIYSPAVPRVGELVNVETENKRYNLKVTDVIYEFEKVGSKPQFGNYGCVDISICVELQ
jgi:hypothetical protein